ncbi:ABC transporter ATP-binding protein [Ornithinimicrobium faecis]|uniref:ABC transporter ATP-binding protein n=1 Tax=Ornithinimicrobium faecis TaxID=2934158 RepID=UPI002118E180|nr:ABC transporter ATP-binding protein [Ornithinimicrobium sp. HY1745]
MTDLALHADSLTRTFRVRRGPDRTALDSINLELATGLVHGLLGPNGAGKTTLCRIASTVLTPTSGRLTVHGCDVARESDQVRRLIGIVFGGDRGLYGRLSARENLEFWCAMNGVPRRDTPAAVEALLERLGLANRATELVETFSRGMKQRLHLARGLVADPPVLLLDEPTVGMDPVSAHEFRVLIEELRREGRTVLLTTHDMAEAQVLCDTVTFIDAGRIVGSGTPDTIRAIQVEGGVRIRIHDLPQSEHDALTLALTQAIPEVSTTHDGGARHTDLVVPPEHVATVVDTVVRRGDTAITTGPPSLEDVYLGLLGQRDGSDRGMGV